MVDILTTKDMMTETVVRVEDMHNNPAKYRGYRIPIPWLHALTGGVLRNKLTYLYGKPKAGKSTTQLAFTMEMMIDGVNFLYLSLEESLENISHRILSHFGDIDRKKFRDITLEPSDWPRLFQASTEIGKFGGHWAFGAYNEKEIVDTVQKINPEILILDYLQLMQMKGKSKVEEIDEASKFLVRLSRGQYTKKVPLAVFATAQLNEQGECLWSRSPDRDGDIIVEVSTIDDTFGNIISNQRRMTVRLNRFGDLGSQIIMFNGSRSTVGEFLVQPQPINQPTKKKKP
jgi:replicative DNA helicase